MSVLRIPKIPQYGVLVEEKYDKEDSLFHDVYQGAIKNVYDIINKHQEKTTEISFNPCIAFVGKRGTGKSSAMSSFANFLHKSKTYDLTWIGDQEIENTIYGSSFYKLPQIDTANMSENETIIADVSAEMYSEYKKFEENILVEQKRNFIEATKKANDTAILKSTGDWTKQGDQLLAETTKVVHIKELFKKMVDNFLSIVLKDTHPDKRYLVIQIDDLDMNVTNSFSIMEEIRSILSIKNVIVLISVDVEQLKTVLKFHFEKSLKAQKDAEKERISRDLSYKYIEKLLPVDRRHYMPELNLEQLNEIRAENFLFEEKEDWDKWKIKLDGHKKPSVLNAIMHLIWRKTLLIPTKNDFGDYPLIPHNLRSLCNFVVFLRNMEDVAYVPGAMKSEHPTCLQYFHFASFESQRNILEHNLEAFQKYLLYSIENFIKPEMSTAEYMISNTLQNLINSISYTSIEKINNKIVGDIINCLNNKTTRHYFELINKNNTLHLMLQTIRQSRSLNIGDVIYVLKEIEKNANRSYIRYLVEIIRTLWSIKMTREFFVTGCNPKNKDIIETNTCYITKSFRNAIGTFIVNPDVDIIPPIYDSNISGWYIRKKDFPSICDVVIPRNESCLQTINADDNIYKVTHWRNKLRNGLEIYRAGTEDEDLIWASHPLLIFSNLLTPALRNYINNSLNDNLQEWQHRYIISLPFYSLSYMQCFSSCFCIEVNKHVFPSCGSLTKYVLEKAYDANAEMWKTLSYYIPRTGFVEKNELKTKTTFNDGEINPFNVSIESLINAEWLENELLAVNLSLIKILEESIRIYESNLPNDPENFSKYLRDIYPHIENSFPETIINNFFPIRHDEIKIDNVKEFLNALTNNYEKNDIVPYYFSKEIKGLEIYDPNNDNSSNGS